MSATEGPRPEPAFCKCPVEGCVTILALNRIVIHLTRIASALEFSNEHD